MATTLFKACVQIPPPPVKVEQADLGITKVILVSSWHRNQDWGHPTALIHPYRLTLTGKHVNFYHLLLIPYSDIFLV